MWSGPRSDITKHIPSATDCLCLWNCSVTLCGCWGPLCPCRTKFQCADILKTVGWVPQLLLHSGTFEESTFQYPAISIPLHAVTSVWGSMDTAPTHSLSQHCMKVWWVSHPKPGVPLNRRLERCLEFVLKMCLLAKCLQFSYAVLNKQVSTMKF